MNPQLDVALCELYLEFDTPADRVLTNPQLAETFFNRVSDRMGVSLERETVFKRLLNLRKKGELPRLRRN
jgi:hypothetical protein